jgi:hypothetical protein
LGRLQELGGRRRGRGRPKGGQEGGGCKTKRGRRRGSARVGGKSGLPSIGSRSMAQTHSHICAPDPSVKVKKKFYYFTEVCLLKL